MDTTRAPDEAAIRARLTAAMAHHDAGRLEEAEKIYREVLGEQPARPDALALLGDALHRKRRHEEAIAALREAARGIPNTPNIHNKLGVVLEESGRLEEAMAAYRVALRLKPDYPEALYNLGNALRAAGQLEPAVAAYRRAVAAAPGYADAHNNLAVALETMRRPAAALDAYRAALRVAHPAHVRGNFARFIAEYPHEADSTLRPWIAQAISQAWARPADLARAAIAVLSTDAAIRPMMERALHAWPRTVSAATLFGGDGLRTLARDPLLLALLGNTQVCDWDFERFLTLARRALLERVLDDAAAWDDDAIGFASALACQCFVNDYVFSCDEAESAQAAALRDRVALAIADSAPIAAQALVLVAAYFPLHSLAHAERLLEGSWPEAVRHVLARQVEEPAEEQAELEAIPALTPIDQAVSRAVRAQYEESPYPRWVGLPEGQALAEVDALRRLCAEATLPARGEGEPLRILVAGCGTGQESLDLARQFPAASILAIDLSRASLAYARRMARRLGIANVEHAQADILALSDLGRRFHLISSVGVLHHLADPLAGWRRLLALLEPGGLMQVGLYSELGRRDLGPARERIAASGAAAAPDNVRRQRIALLESGEFPRVAALRDLYGANECRDLLFHVQEHRFTVPQLRRMIETLDVEFVGFAVPEAVGRAFDARHPGGRRDLDSWDAFERDFPDTFAGMYLFWVRSRATAS